MRWLIAILMGVGIVLILIWQLDDPAPDVIAPPEAPTGPDYWMEGVLMERFDAAGQRILDLQATRMAHFPDDERTELDTVLAHQRGPEQLNWTLKADHGLITGDHSEIHLRGDVRVLREPSQGPVSRIFTDTLLFLPEIDRAETDDPVRIERQDTVTTGRGLIAELAEDRLRILEEVRTRHGMSND
ncbi:lipopolysaccharide export system protein LptC [Natronospira proteinivora]|uniref:Lipopolysaccharide export system protein LptC n=1 Tax=Natronospira proteinivora TaxID=1807133 RepID=A0ABT1G447_9GAMM|nr:LPS export ABC transporter periplasmic protein LptC [Natronospira proteinivora]MCP1726077.1 lipopolysaccharide export system protein LptC [Natronospira proteinivora]